MTLSAVLLSAGCVVSILLSGCAAERLHDKTQELVPISLTASVRDGNFLADTRAGVNVQNTQLADGSTFVAEFTGSDVNVSSTVYQADGEGGTTIADGYTQPCFTFSGSSTTVHAYHPSKPSETFSVAADQSSDASYQASDLMYATVAVTKENPSGNLSFTHKMAKIVVNATVGDAISITSVKIVGGSRTINVTDATACTLGTTLTDANSADANGTCITAFSGTHSTGTLSCAALIPPQTVGTTEESVPFLQIVTNAGTVTYSLAGKAFASGQCYTFNVHITAASIGTNTDITDWADNGSVTIGGGSGGEGSLTLSPTSLSLTYQGEDAVIIPSMDGATIFYAASDNTSIATVTRNEEQNEITVHPVRAGSCGILVFPLDAQDGFTTARCAVTVDKIAPAVSLSRSSWKIVRGYTKTFTVTKDGDGEISVTSSNNSVATASVDQTTGVVTINGVASGSATITVRLAEGTNYNAYAAADKTVSVEVLNQCTGTALASSSVGQTICEHGRAHASTTGDLSCAGDKVALIFRKGSTGNSTYTNGIAISLADFNGSPKWRIWGSVEASCVPASSTFATAKTYMDGVTYTATLVSAAHSSHNHEAAIAANGFTPVISGTKWHLGSMGEWCAFLEWTDGGTAVKAVWDWNYDDTRMNKANKKLTDAGGDPLKGYGSVGIYWLSTQYDNPRAIGFNPNVNSEGTASNGYGYALYPYGMSYGLVRPFLAF